MNTESNAHRGQRKSIPKRQSLRIWRRDGWHCRYCEIPLFFAPTLKLLHDLNPHHSYHQGGGKAGEMLPLFRWGWASVDQIVPVTGGGQNEDDNLVSACWRCNLAKRNKNPESFTSPSSVPEEVRALQWDGFSGLYPTLVEQPDEWARLIVAAAEQSWALL